MLLNSLLVTNRGLQRLLPVSLVRPLQLGPHIDKEGLCQEEDKGSERHAEGLDKISL